MTQSYRFIAVDLDDVLFDFLRHFFQWHNEQYGTTLRPEDMVYETIWEAWGGTKEEATDRIPRFFQEVNMLSMDPIDGAATALGQLKDRFELTIISARDPSAADVTQVWINNYFPEVFDEVVLGIGNPMAESRLMTKADVCKQIGADVLIDDQLAHARNVAAAGIHVLLFGHGPWNQAKSLPAEIRRVEDWAHVVRVLLDED